MGDVGDLWREVAPEWKARSQQKRAKNRESSAKLLVARGIKFRIENNGAHIIITHVVPHIDFWPGTGLWIQRNTNTFKKKEGRGVAHLIRYIERVVHLHKPLEFKAEVARPSVKTVNVSIDDHNDDSIPY
jgi:hypothetical protein